MPKDESVNVADSLAGDEDAGDQSESGSKTSLKTPSLEDRLAELQKGNQAKDKVIAELKEFKESAETRLNELADKKEEEGRLSSSEQDEVAQLKSAMRKIRDNPSAKPWLETVKEDAEGIAKKISKDTLFQYDYLQAFKMVKATAKTLKLDAKEFESEVANILRGGRWMTDEKGRDLLPTERVENAIDEYMSLAELRKKSKAEAAPAEGEGRAHRGASGNTAIKSALEKGDSRNLLAAIAAKQEKNP